MIETERIRGILLKIGALVFMLVLILCLVNPVWKARDNKVDEYRDLYRYQLTAQNYYRAMHSSIYNLTVLASEMETRGAYITLSARKNLLDTDEDLNNKIYKLYATLRTIPDPGDRGLVSSVLDTHEAYEAYRALIFSGNYHSEDYLDILHELRDELRACERDLFKEAYEE